jgi:EpsD family peptidyl-prolyl cis-trans isomerase
VKSRGLSVAIALLGALSGCGNGGASEPGGQVIATVDGEEITTAELKFELGDDIGNLSMEQATKAALTALISRKLLAAEAKTRGLDKSPTAAMARKRADELADILLLQQSIAKNVQKVWDRDAEGYITANPAKFENRRLLSVNQLLVTRTFPALTKKIEPLNDLGQIEAVLTANNADFVRTATVLDTVRMAPTAADRIKNLGLNDVLLFTTPSGGLEISQIVGVRSEPLAGAEATRIARGILTQQRNNEEVQRAMDDIVKAGEKKVKYNPKFSTKSAEKAETK